MKPVLSPRLARARIPMKAFEDLYLEHVQSVFRFAMSVVGHRETAEDLTSDAFLALASKPRLDRRDATARVAA